MKVTSIELHPDSSDLVCVLSFRDPTRENPYNVKGITGLDADELISRFYGAPGADAYYNMISVKREPVFLIEYNPRYELNQSVESLRSDIYRMIASSRKAKVEIQFKNGETVVAVLNARFSKVEANHFSKTPETQMTFTCEDPFLKAPDMTSLSVVGLDPALTVIRDDISTAPHGFKFEMEFTGVLDGFKIQDPDDPDWEFEVVPVGGFLVGDVLHFSSELNDKYLYVVRAGNTIQLADRIVSGSVWPLIFPARDNKFSVDSPGSYDWEAITYYETFWGV